MNKICEISAGDFFTQKLMVKNIAEHSWEYCIKLSRNQKVLHVGCSDYPLFNPATNMHLHISYCVRELHGCDPNGIEELKKYYNGAYYRSLEEVIKTKQEYDVILATNIIEHVQNPGNMLKQLFEIKFEKLFILVPNYSISNQAKYDGEIFTEKIHPDHYAWYSPYTLFNLCKEPMQQIGAGCEMNFFDAQNMISILITK